MDRNGDKSFCDDDVAAIARKAAVCMTSDISGNRDHACAVNLEYCMFLYGFMFV